MTASFTRDIALDPGRSALIFIDVQNFAAARKGGMYRGLTDAEIEARYGWYFDQLEQNTIPNMQRVQAACRSARVEVLYTTIESLTEDGRDRSLDYRITGFHVPKGSWDGQVVDAIKPLDDEIRLPKTSSSVFISTVLDYVLRNLGIRQLVVAGLLTDQCVESAVRDGCDLGYLVTLVTDACTSQTKQRHDNSLKAIKGYCRQVTTDQLVTELAETTGSK